MRGHGFALLICGAIWCTPQPTLAAASLDAAQLRTCRSQGDEAKRLACYDSLGLEKCRWEAEKAERLSCYDALAKAATAADRKR